MELTLTRQAGSQVLVTCDDQPSHTFDLLTLIPHEKELQLTLDDTVAYGKAIYAALFPPETLARRALANTPERILLITTDNDLDAVPWEYAHGPDGFLVLECHFVRGLPADQRIAPPTLDIGLHIVAIPSNPLSHDVEPLNIDGEWMRLKEIIQQVPYAITLERTRPPTIEQIRTLVANQHHRIIHFMGHGGQDEKGAILYFEKDNGDLDPVTARQFVMRVRGNVFLVTLNACVSATPGATTFGNLAASLVRQKTPYALGIRFSIPDEDARAFSRSFYSDLASGVSVEEALLQARLTLANSSRPWVVGVPVLYTSLAQPAASFASLVGIPIIREHQPHMEVSVLPRAEGAFQGRIDELKALGTALTGDSRPPIVTIHGGGGQGKTALACEAVERFGYAWPGGVWATSLEHLPSREVFINDLARFLGIDTRRMFDLDEVENLVTTQLADHRTLIVLDNAETLIEAVEANNEKAVRLAQFIREQLPRPPVGLLATSRSFLGWASETGCELTGLASIEGVRLFQQFAPQRLGEIDQAGAWELSEQVGGHPLSLRLLGSAFNASDLVLAAFLEEYETYLLKVEDKYKDVDHRHRTLYASIETSIRYLDTELRALLSGLWVFHAPFLSEIAVFILHPEYQASEGEPSPIDEQISTLWQRGLLARVTVATSEETLLFYRLLPTMRLYVERHLEQAYEREMLLTNFGASYFEMVTVLYTELNSNAGAVIIAQQAREDFERGATWVTGIEQGQYFLYWGWVSYRLGNPRHGLHLCERALEIAQGREPRLEAHALDHIAGMYRVIGRPQEALGFYEKALAILQEMGNQAEAATTLSNLAGVYRDKAEQEKALQLYIEAFSILQNLGDQVGAAATLNNMAEIYSRTGRPQEALSIYQVVVPLAREIGDRVGIATALDNMATVYADIGKPLEALTLYKEILPMRREAGDRTGEATTLNNMALIYAHIGRYQEALDLFAQALLIYREVGDRAGEANTIQNMATSYHTLGKLQEALQLYEEVLSVMKEVERHAEEASTLSNMATVYTDMGRLQEALDLFKKALSIRRAVRDRAGEANTLNNMAALYRALKLPQDALNVLEEAVSIMREVGNLVGEVTVLINKAWLLHHYLNRSEEASDCMERAIALVTERGLTQEETRLNLSALHELLQEMRSGTISGTQASDSADSSSSC